MHEIETVCDQVAIVVAGRLRSQATVRDLLQALPLRVQVRVPEGASRRVHAALDRHPGTKFQGQGDHLRLEIAGDPLELLSDLSLAGARDAVFEDKDLEETFLHLYADQPPEDLA